MTIIDTDAAEVDVTKTVQAPTEGDKSQVKAEDKTPESATEGENEDGTTTTDETEPERKKRKDGGFQRRINRLTADFRAAEAKAESAERKAQELEARLNTPAKDDDLKAPHVDDFNTYEDYERADREYIADRTRRETLKVLEEQRKKDADKKSADDDRERIAKARERFEVQAEKVAENYEDFDEVMDDFYKGRSPLKNFDRAALEFIFEGEGVRGPELIYHLHQNEDAARKIAGLRPSLQVAELVRLEASLAKPGANNVSKAPAPPRQVGAKGGSDGKDPEKMSIEEMRLATKTRRRVDY